MTPYLTPKTANVLRRASEIDETGIAWLAEAICFELAAIRRAIEGIEDRIETDQRVGDRP